jgi:hypothetical protein
VLPFSNVVNFFSDKLARLSGWRFTFARILASPFQRFLLRHFSTPLLCTVRESFHNERVVRTLRRKLLSREVQLTSNNSNPLLQPYI